MEIRIKTPQEFHDSHVTIELVADRPVVVETSNQEHAVGGPWDQRQLSGADAELQRQLDVQREDGELQQRQLDEWARRAEVQIELERSLRGIIKDLDSRLAKITRLVHRKPIDRAMEVRVLGSTDLLSSYSIIMAGTLASIRAELVPPQLPDEKSDDA